MMTWYYKLDAIAVRLMILGYARVSTIEQSEEYDALKQQIKRLEDAGATTVLFDIESGSSDRREKFNEVLRLVKQGKVRELLITRIDRLGRRVVGISKAVQLLNEHNVHLRILDAPVDATSSFGKFSINQMGAMAEFESAMLSERTRHGMEYFRQQQKLQKATFGYKLNADHKLEIDLEKLPIAREIVDKLLAGYSFGAISKYMFEERGIKLSVSGLRHWIKSPIILGHTRYFTEMENRRNPKNPREPKIIHNTHAAIATDLEITTILASIKTCPRLSQREEKNYPLKGLLRCAECGGGMHRIISRYKSGETHWIRCSKHSQNIHFCPNKKNSRLTILNSQVITGITGKASQIVAETSIGGNADRCGSEAMRGYQGELEILESIPHPSYTIKAAIADLKLKISAEEAKGKQVEKFDAQTREKLQAFSQAAFWESLDEDKLCLAFRFFVDSVLVDGSGNVEIKFLL